MVIATDVQGAEVAKPWVEKAGGTYRALLDQDNTIGNTFGVKYVPVGILIDEYGRLVKDVASVNIGDHAFRQDLERWATEGMPDGWSADKPAKRVDRTPEEEEADARFQLAVVLLKKGEEGAGHCRVSGGDVVRSPELADSKAAVGDPDTRRILR